MNSITITMPYIGGSLSVNHYLGRNGRRVFIKKEVVEWKEDFGWKIKMSHIEDWKMPISVTCNGKFKDLNNAPDLSNLSKVIMDSIEDITHINDRNYRWHDGAVILKKDEDPELQIIIEEAV